jgi:GNAT superfamily N-acetyltransferase
LLDRLVARAREEGVERFTALVLAENTDVLRLIERLGDSVTRSEGPQLEIEVELPERPEPSASLRFLLAEAARGLVVPAISMWRQVAEFARQHERGDVVTEPANVIVAHAHGASVDAPAVTVASGLAAARDSHIHLVESYWPVLSDRDEIDNRLSATANELRRKGIGVTTHLAGGDIVDAVIDVAEETNAGLIVIDAPAADATNSWHAYWMASRVCARAPCDVLIARNAP